MKTIKVILPLLCLFICFSNLTNCGIKPTVQASSVNPEDLEDEIAEKKKKIKELDKDLEDLKEDIDDLEDKEDDLEDEEEELDEREEELEERIRELERTPDATRQRELEEKRAELERVKARRDQINTDLTNIRNQINTKTAKIKQLSRRKLEAIVAEAEAENKLAQAHKERAENAYDNAKVLVDRANGLSNVPTEANSRDKPAANSALSDAEDDRDTTRTKASEAQTAYNDANTAKNGIDDDSTLAQIESAITTAETKRDLAETKAGEADTSADATVTHADEAIAKANIVIEAVRANTEHQRNIAREQRRTAERERDTARNERDEARENLAIANLENEASVTLNAYSGSCPSDNDNGQGEGETYLTGKLSNFKTHNRSSVVFDKTTSKGSDTPSQDIIHKLDLSSSSQVTVWVKESVIPSHFAGSNYKWFLYSVNGGTAPKIELNPSSVTPSGGFYKFNNISYTKNSFFNGARSNSELNSYGFDVVFAIGRTGKCWSVTK